MKKRGIGIGSIMYGTGYGNGFPDVSKAVAELCLDGRVAIYVGATEVGQGAKTIMSQIPAEILGLSVDEILFICEDSSITPDAGTAAASRQTYNTGNAIKIAAEKLKEAILISSKEKLGLNTTIALEVKEGRVFVKSFPEKSISFRELAQLLKENPLQREGEFTAQTTQIDTETGQGAPYWPYTFSTYGIEVEVDTTTGIVDIIRAVCAQDVGRAINPKLVEGQIDGGFAMGLGYALFEDLNLVKGEVKNNRFSSYLIPTAMDIPEIEKIIVEDPESTGPFGAKGIGEPVMLGVAPAVLNAIYNAIGVRINEIPVTPDVVLSALKKKEV